MHKHHIIPKHMGGSDDPSNLVEVSVDKHAELHFALYLEHGKLEDYLAAKSLSNQLDDDAFYAKSVLGGKKSTNAGKSKSQEHKTKLSISNKGKHTYLEKYRTPEDQQRRSRLGNLKRWGRRDILSPTGPKIPV